MREYQLVLIAPQRIEAFRLEAETYRRMQAPSAHRRGPRLDATRIVAIVRFLVRRVVPAS